MKLNYLTLYKTILNNDGKTKSPIIDILNNGNNQVLRSILVIGKSYTLTNTCVFDSIYQVLYSLYADITEYVTLIDANLSKTLFSLISNSIRDNINA